MKTPLQLVVPVAAWLVLAAAAQVAGQGQAQPQAQTAAPQGQAPAQEQRGGSSSALQQKLAPGLATYTDEVLYGDVWSRTELSARDRSLVTISVLIATGKSAQLVGHLGRALDNGVQPSEASGVLTHLALYCGWPSAVTALDVYEQVYTARKVDIAALRDLRPSLPAPATDAARARAVNEQFRRSHRRLRRLLTRWYSAMWRRSDLSVQDPSLVTIAALAATGDDDQFDFYLRRGEESGLTRDQISEALIDLGFYAGWSKATSAMTAVTRTLGRPPAPSAQTVAPSSNFTGAVSVTESFSGTGGARLGGSKAIFSQGRAPCGTCTVSGSFLSSPPVADGCRSKGSRCVPSVRAISYGHLQARNIGMERRGPAR